MSILLRVGLHRSRLAPVAAAAAAMIIRHSVRDIMDYPFPGHESSLYDLFLHKSDLPPYDEDYFKVVDKEYFTKKYGDAKRIFIYDSAPPVDPDTQQRIKTIICCATAGCKEPGNYTNSIPFGHWSPWRIVSGYKSSVFTNATKDSEGSLHK